MTPKSKLNLFISYSHSDEEHIKEFIEHITPLKNNGLLESWHDRKIIAGNDFVETIDNNLEKADIICLFISAKFLSSNACLAEKKKALEFKKRKGVVVVPIILSPCGWLDDKDINHLLAFPTDGNPISSYSDSNSGWYNVYCGLKEVVEKEIRIKQLTITQPFTLFLQNTELLSRAHSKKEEVLLDDIFIYPDLVKYDELREYEKKISSVKLKEYFIDCEKIIIAGEGQSGKTTLCKILFIELRKMNFVPIYINDKTNLFHGKLENKILDAFKEQYELVKIEDIDSKRIVPIIDDFHFAKNKRKHIQYLTGYCYHIVIVDDIFSMNLEEEKLIRSYTHFKIEEISPSLRHELIKKWVVLSDKNCSSLNNDNEIYHNIDTTTELVNSSLGKVIGSGIMPAYPFYILSVISTYETIEKPLDQQITSQGYCYQALIYMYLRKQGVKNDEIDTYINFLTEFAFYLYKESKNVLSSDEFDTFMKIHLGKYNFPIQQKTLLYKLRQARIILIDSFNNCSFCYLYLYYYFVAKYLAEHLDDNNEIIKSIIKNLHKDENAYIAIFISHHTTNYFVIDEIIKYASLLFERYKPASLKKEELSFFDEQVNIIVKAVLPSSDATPEKERFKRLKEQDVIEEKNKQESNNSEDIEEDNSLSKELRSSIKTVEVMGCIIKNRSGSLEKSKLEKIFQEAMFVHLRILTSFFDLIKNENEQSSIVDFISNRLNKIIKEKTKKPDGSKNQSQPSQEQVEKWARNIFWSTNFFIVFGFIEKIIHSLGSDKLTLVVDKICMDENTPASFIVKHGILMWYNKNLQVDAISKRMEEDGFSETAKRIIRFQIVNHCSMHSIKHSEKQNIEKKFGIPSKVLLKQDIQRNQKL